MGQTCNAIVYGCKLPPIDDRDPTANYDKIYRAASEHRPMFADVYFDAGLIGIEIAVGGSGHRCVIDMNGLTIEISPQALREHEIIGRQIAEAERQWPLLVRAVSMATSGKIVLTDAPRIYLTETETA